MVRIDRFETARAFAGLDFLQQGAKVATRLTRARRGAKQPLTVYDLTESIAELRRFAERFQSVEQHLTVYDLIESIAELRLRVSQWLAVFCCWFRLGVKATQW